SALRHINPQVRANAAQALGRLGEVPGTAAAALERAARDEDAGVRTQAVLALGGSGGAGSPVAVLLRALADPGPQVRGAAAEALGGVGKGGEAPGPARRALRAAGGDPTADARAGVRRVPPPLAGPTPAVVAGLCTLLRDDTVLAQAAAAQALGRLGEAAAAAG